MPITISTGLMKYRNQNGTYEDINAVSYEAGVATHICSSSEYNATTRIPTVQNPEENIFYLVPAENGTSPDMFVEWIYANNAWERFGNVTLDIPVEDVQINGSSIVNNGVANVPIGGVNTLGVVKTGSGISISNTGALNIYKASHDSIKGGTVNGDPIVPSNQHEAVFYGLAKAAGSDMASSANAVGTYTSEAKTAIQNMLDVPAKSDIPSVPVQDVQVNGTSVLSNGTANIPIANDSTFGIVRTNALAGITVSNETNKLVIKTADYSQVRSGTDPYRPITPSNQDRSVFYGLAKASGYDESSNTNIGAYTDEAKTAIQNMLGTGSDDALIKKPIFGTPEVILDTTTLSFHKDGDDDWYCTDEDPIQGFTKTAIVYDCIYKVEWDGIEYPEELAVSYSKTSDTGWYEWTGIGNVNFLGNSTNYTSTAPFVIAYDYHRNSNEIQFFTEDNSASHTIKIIKIPFVKIENKEQFYNDVHNNIPIIRKGTGLYSTIIGEAINASGEASFAEGGATIASGNYSHAEGSSSIASGKYAHAEGARSKASGNRSHAEGFESTASGLTSHTEGYQTTASGANSHAEGDKTVASGACSHAEGEISTASNDTAHAEGYRTLASGVDSHVEGEYSIASGNITHAEGFNTIAAGSCSHVHGKSNVADSYESLPEWVANTEYAVGDKVKVTTTSNDITTVKGYSCKTANNDSVFDSSKWNANPTLNYAEIVGNGASSDARSNAYALTWAGDGKYAGHVYVGANADSSGGTMLPEDIQINGTSIVNNGVANIPLANTSTIGALKVGNGFYINPLIPETVNVNIASNNDVKNGSANHILLPVGRIGNAAFYGLAKAAGDTTQSQSDNAVGTYTADAKTAIQSMLGVPGDVQVNGTSVVSNGVANIPIASSSDAGAVKIDSSLGIGIDSTSKKLFIDDATDANVKAGTEAYKPIVPRIQHNAVFYGLAKAAGDITQSQSNNAVGTYTADAKSAIQNMLGVPGDVQVNGTSIVNNGVANIPIGSSSDFGVYKVGTSFGVRVNDNGVLRTDAAGSSTIKAGTNGYFPIVPLRQHESVFYGLATAAGDTTQASSSNAVGTYTTEAKAAIHTMLGIDPVAIAAQVEIPLIETVSGTTPSITGQPNIRYNCGEVSTISITPPASGSIDVFFESGSTAAVLTVPNTVKWPEWFDASSLEADTVYEILITDGVYGSVMTWAA